MSAGYGRGYYGERQLARDAPKRRGGWLKVALVVGVGAAAWALWRRKFGTPQAPPAYPEGMVPTGSLTLPAPTALLQAPPRGMVEQIALVRGYPSTAAYEDDVVAMAQRLRDVGGKVDLAPHLAHLAARLA